jgi:hypothetical protein
LIHHDIRKVVVWFFVDCACALTCLDLASTHDPMLKNYPKFLSSAFACMAASLSVAGPAPRLTFCLWCRVLRVKMMYHLMWCCHRGEQSDNWTAVSSHSFEDMTGCLSGLTHSLILNETQDPEVRIASSELREMVCCHENISNLQFI